MKSTMEEIYNEAILKSSTNEISPNKWMKKKQFKNYFCLLEFPIQFYPKKQNHKSPFAAGNPNPKKYGRH